MSKAMVIHQRVSASALVIYVSKLPMGACSIRACSISKLRRLVPHVDKAPLPLRILRLVTSNFLPVENPTHPTAHAPERASVYILGQFRTSK